MRNDPWYRVFVCRKCGRIISECRPPQNCQAEPTIEPIDACAVCDHKQKA